MWEHGLVQDGILARSREDERRLWTLREAVGDVDAPMGPHISFDLSVSPFHLGRFCAACDAALILLPQAGRVIKVGHLGDGNVHLLVAHDGSDKAARLISEAVYDVVRAYRGSVTAEHGVGRIKRDWLAACRDPAKLAVMRAIKRALDPQGLMNPGAVID